MPKLKEMQQLASHLLSLRTKRLARWREIGRLILPSRGLFDGEDSEGLREANLFNPAAGRALRKAAAGMTQAITPASNPWFRHSFLGQDDREQTGANAYAGRVDDLLYEVLKLGGFYQAIHAFNKELLAFGCAMLACEEHPYTLARYSCQTCGTWAVSLDEDRRLAAVYRRLTMTPLEMEHRFGKERLTNGTQQKLEKEPYARITVHHLVQRREQRDPQKLDRRNMPIGSWWWEDGGQDFLAEGGFMSMPFFFSVWEEARGIYGTGPGDEALADQKAIEGWEQRKIVGIEKMIAPPMVSHGPLKTYVDTMPDAINASPGGNPDSLRPLYEVNFGPAVQHVQEEINQVSIRLEDIMMANIFANMSLETRPAGMTMTEYMDRRRRAAELMGPTVSSYETRILSPLLERTYELLDAAGFLPEPPENLSLMARMQASYQSPMAQMLEQSGAVAIMQFMELLPGLLQANPDSVHKIRFDQIIDEIAQRTGVPASIINSDEEANAIRQQIAEAQAAQQQQMAEAQMLQQLAQIGNVKTQGTVAGQVLGDEEVAA